MPDIALSQLILLQLLVLGASIAVGVVSFGFAMIMSPLFLLFLEPRLVIEINLVLFTFLTAAVLFSSWRYMDRGTVLALLAASLATMPLGVLALNAMDGRVLRIAIIATVLLLVVVAMSGRYRPFNRERLAALPVGAVVGFIYTALALGGPFIALFALNQGWNKDRARANLAAYFTITGPIILAFHGYSGLFGLNELKTAALFLPALVVGSLLGLLLVRRVNERHFRFAVLAVLFAASFLVLGRELAAILW